jgi:hypothetical protein
VPSPISSVLSRRREGPRPRGRGAAAGACAREAKMHFRDGESRGRQAPASCLTGKIPAVHVALSHDQASHARSDRAAVTIVTGPPAAPQGRQIEPQPVRHAVGAARDDHLVGRPALERYLDRNEWVRVHHRLDTRAGGLPQQRQRHLDHRRDLLGLRVPVPARHQQHERALTVMCTPAHLLQELRRRCSAVRQDEDPRRRAYR